MRQYLVVANQTLVGEDLLREVAARVRAGNTRFQILVPATPPAEGWSWTETEARHLAQDRLDRTLLRLQEEGVQADGMIGDADPLLAIQDALRDQRFDEIIISTLPPRASAGLRSGLVRRVGALVDMPVIHVMAPPERATRETALSQVSLFKGLSKHRIRRLAKASTVSVYREGEHIIREGSAGSELFVILDGRVKVVRGGRTLAHLGSGEVFGEISLLAGGPRTADVIAEIATRCVYLSGTEFRAALEADPLIAMRVLQAVGERMQTLVRSAT
ncbi:MAG TPA: cyclic nucleotide-binding domain-containing protein [Actinomycetota bacterium]